MGYTHTYDALVPNIKILPVSGLRIGMLNVGLDTDWIEFLQLESDSTLAIRAIMLPTDRGGHRVQAVNVEMNALIAHNRYEEMSGDIVEILTRPFSDVEIILEPLAGQDAGARMEIHARDPNTTIADWELSAFEVASAAERPRMNIRVIGILSVEVFVRNLPSGLFNQISGF